MKIAIFGNSGSGKSTLARKLTADGKAAFLELDSIVWEPDKIAVLRKPAEMNADLEKFLAENENWVVEGCYGELIEKILPFCTELLFLNPGAEVCLANNRKRPWEPHKYTSPEAQNEMLENLLSWVKGYYTRDDQWSLAYHRRVFDKHLGQKREITDISEI